MLYILFSFLFIPTILAYKGPVMGKLTACDDAKTGIDIDWDPRDFTTFTCPNQYPITVEPLVEPVHFELKTYNNTKFDPRKDVVTHKCIKDNLQYDYAPPIRGAHRPNWAKYGEYLYLPEQRWLHNLEHGSIILLYHPCVDQKELAKLRQIVTGCLYRHIVTPYNKLTEKRPLALIAWGAKLEMNTVDETKSLEFIKKHARVAPEDIATQGLYDQYLINPAKVVNNEMDDGVCDNYKSQA